MRLISSTILVLVATHTVRAEPDLGIIARGGPCAATFNQDYRINRYGMSGAGGGYLEYPFSTAFSLEARMELGYTARGAKIVVDDELQGKNRLHYFELLATARPTAKLGPTRVYLLLGAGLNLLGSARDENAMGMSRGVTDELRRVDVALLAGAGAALRLRALPMGPLTLGTVFVEARHDRGLVDVDKLDLGFKNRTTSVMIGVSFALASRSRARPAAPPPRSAPPSPVTAAAPAR